MSTYIVTFENNRAVSSARTDRGSVDPLDIDQTNDKDEIKSMTIFATDKEKSMDRANEIAHQIISRLHSSLQR